MYAERLCGGEADSASVGPREGARDGGGEDTVDGALE